MSDVRTAADVSRTRSLSDSNLNPSGRLRRWHLAVLADGVASSGGMPSTMSAWRLRPATSASALMVSVRRRLTFDTCDSRSSVSTPSSTDDDGGSSSTCRTLRENEQAQKKQQSIRWNFDFDHGTPLDGRYQWSEVTHPGGVIDADGVSPTAAREVRVPTSFVPIEPHRYRGTVTASDGDDYSLAGRWQPTVTHLVNAQTQTRPDAEFVDAVIDRSSVDGLPEPEVDQNNNFGGVGSMTDDLQCDVTAMQVDESAAGDRVTCTTGSAVERWRECNSRRPQRQHAVVALGISTSAGRTGSRRANGMRQRRLKEFFPAVKKSTCLEVKDCAV